MIKQVKDLGVYKREGATRARHYLLLECECGNQFEINKDRVNKINSCPFCAKSKGSTRHGMSRTDLYSTFMTMNQRCYNPNVPNYEYYGGKGIGVCKEWKEDKSKFFKWALDNGYQEGLTIERKDGERWYEPSNCIWIPQSLQSRNLGKRKNTSSKYIGVSYDNKNLKWSSQISVNKINKKIGRFDTEDEAMKAREKYIDDNNLKHYKRNIDDNSKNG